MSVRTSSTRELRKRASKDASATKVTKKPKISSKELNLYFKSYKGGLGDFHIPIFKSVNDIAKPTKVLYPGCHRHITASLIFEDVVYVDNYSKVQTLYDDPKALAWIDEHKEYNNDAKIKFKCKNFEGDFGEKVNSFDLIMSMSAGIVTKSGSKYLKKSGYFLVSDAHFDARMINLDPNFKLTHVWQNDQFDYSEAALEGHFTTKDGKALTEAMVLESIDKPKAKRSFKLQKEAIFYLFKKIK
ncbi:uncharacterized protein LOC130647559 [Hydractinia symbiolongicarpus]|uniref:uncharacterized protein LOC130647559 n=1 Tax=Hydractinia symbiolongicarpus TaxID=13093 RepID=UPI00254BFDD1|nr:uncharacterized protein LOC130647559 [Hydractinia symbiolongicarpus]